MEQIGHLLARPLHRTRSGNAKGMREVYALIDKVAATRTTVLVLGESGVGKELVANAIHYNSPNAEGPFIKVNCAALPESLAESELFGHEKGSFTGATMMHKGYFEQASGGTIFLDEVGELSLTVQAKLLRVLQERTVERVGGSKPVKVDVRIIAATNRDLAEMVGQGTFREDLYYRLDVFPIPIPPLRERGSDIITLADHFVTSFAKENRREVKRISTPALNMLMSYHWPGNVRELENVIEQALVMGEGPELQEGDLPAFLRHAPPPMAPSAQGANGAVPVDDTRTLDETLAILVDLLAKLNHQRLNHRARFGRHLRAEQARHHVR